MRWSIVFGTLLTAMTQSMAADTLSFRVVSFNIRYAATASTYEKPWSVRGPLVINKVSATVASATAAGAVPIVGMQEVLRAQLLDIAAGLGSSWSYIGTRTGRRQAGRRILPSLLPARPSEASSGGVLVSCNGSRACLELNYSKKCFGGCLLREKG
ncbi:hypothetical protein NUW58_g8233 [Xylaria curta]|uniref:Uncharacterized protein n=1 Tax=Xylaria curta TaxID=42375 RepID=A0ACC1NB92_9PEZI|nr:hypothetical protein NUW58_g8233 [Xylaria curta]